MGQQIVAGIGNLYADEILYQARIHPLTPIEKLDLKRLFKATKEVLERGIEHTIEGKPFPDSYLWSHRGKGDDCPCGGKVEYMKIGGRTTYFCPKCQSLPYR